MRTKRLSKVTQGSFNISSNCVNYKNGKLYLNIFAAKYSKNNKLTINLHDKFLENFDLKNVTILYNGFNIELLITYDDKKEVFQKKDNGNYLSIDPGMHNHLTLFATSGKRKKVS